MPAFRYEALDASGKSSTGLLEADNARSARAQLRGRELVPISVSPVAAPSGQTSRAQVSRRIFGSAALAVWSR